MTEIKIYTRSEILANRKTWAAFLMTKGRKKATSKLDAGGGSRCCLGHGCYVMGLKPHKNDDFDDHIIFYEESYELAPMALIDWLGLWDEAGGTRNEQGIDVFGKGLTSEDESYHNLPESLATANDETKATPLQIGRYILTVIEGGEATPFRPLTDFAE